MVTRYRQFRRRYLTGSWGGGQRCVLWLNIGGRRPLAHLPRWRRHLMHLPAVRWRVWPRPWNFNGPVVGYRRGYHQLEAQIMGLAAIGIEDGRLAEVKEVLDRAG